MIKGFVIERPAKVHVNQNNIAPIIFKDYIFCKHYAVVKCILYTNICVVDDKIILKIMLFEKF